MRPVTILLGILIILLAVVGIQQRRVARDELAAAQLQTQNATDTLLATQAELTTFRSQHVATVNQLQQLVATLTADKAVVEGQLQQARQLAESLKQELEDARKAAQELQDRLAAMEEEKQKLAAESAMAAEKPHEAEEEFVARETPPAGADDHPSVAPEPETSPEPAPPQPQARPFNRKRRSADAVDGGNRGILFHGGRWYTVMPPVQQAP